jgi:hypothetical protein
VCRRNRAVGVVLSVSAQADHRQGRGAARGNARDCRSRRLERSEFHETLPQEAAKTAHFLSRSNLNEGGLAGLSRRPVAP